jgi:hypothetical protein
MADPKDPVVPAAVPEEKSPETNLTDKDLESVSGGLGHASLPLAQKNIGQSLTQGGRSVISSIGGGPNVAEKLDKW